MRCRWRPVEPSHLGPVLYSLVLERLVRPANTIRFCVLEPRARDFYDGREAAVGCCVAVLRAAVGRDQHNRGTSDLVGEPSTHCHEFRTRRAAHNVRFRLKGVKHFNHLVVGASR
jgi:hypothetical protein